MSLTLVLSGCAGTFSGAGPFKSSIETTTEAYTLVDISASTITPFMRSAQEPTLATVANSAPAKTSLMAGDVIDVLITDNAAQGIALFAPLATGGTQIKVRLDHQGMISLPYVGRKKVAGMTPMQVETLIRRKLKGVTSDVQVHVELVADLSGSVLVAGAVKSPGRFSTLQGPLTLLDVINQAGGPIMEPHLVSVTVRSSGKVETISYEEVLAGNNWALTPRAEVVVERSRQRFVAMGAVAKPGLHDLPQKNTSLLDALGAVGGLKENIANAQGVFVFRLDEHAPDKPLVMRVDLRDPAAIFFAKRIVLKPDDTLYVTNAAVHEWQKVITPIVQTLILGNALGNSAN
ncbi:sugar transporter [Pseudomonas syringae]|uniref:Sugar transporter n=2 Tax=Pseudomonas syringae TaxID=317 RepID=A0A085VQD4_PSESX|nr:sugar transporter [Pseudomonas syringae]